MLVVLKQLHVLSQGQPACQGQQSAFLLAQCCLPDIQMLDPQWPEIGPSNSVLLSAPAVLQVPSPPIDLLPRNVKLLRSWLVSLPLCRIYGQFCLKPYSPPWSNSCQSSLIYSSSLVLSSSQQGQDV